MNALLNHMNTEQSEAVKTTEGPLLIMARCWFREDTCFNT
ncbi:ATP-dependent DNA helicase UvrD/PcrA [Staphylococcus aureus]|nr:ATP-dependent DNA helicase UvrD/PcrA [Staphylococcus aureus]